MTENTQTQILNKLEMVITVTQRNEKWLSELSTSVDELKSDVADLKSDVADLKFRVSGLERDVAEVKFGQEKILKEFIALNRGMNTLAGNVLRMEGRVDDIEIRLGG
ncbi:MAG: hypothetical protein IPN69_16730 [Acidobacteria bacterium]|nr:hypothetical protein [Acidobacteriota bacterium]MBK8812356.1 hypothetical protein [Acidobacteriota bacterium]